MYEVFKAKVAKVRWEQKLTNQAIANKAGLTKSTVAAFMCGARESERTAKAISKALDIDL